MFALNETIWKSLKGAKSERLAAGAALSFSTVAQLHRTFKNLSRAGGAWSNSS